MQILQPPGWRRPGGYSNGIAAEGRLVFVAGMVGWDENCEFQSDDFIAQSAQALKNTVAVLAEAGAGPEHIVRITWYVGDKAEYLGALKDVGTAYRDIIGRHYPAMAVIEVKGFVEEGAKMEMEATAVIPD